MTVMTEELWQQKAKEMDCAEMPIEKFILVAELMNWIEYQSDGTSVWLLN